MGKEYYIRRTAWISSFLVVVSITFRIENLRIEIKFFFIFFSFSVFWDLYCAAPERRDTCEHSSEAKAFHDYVSGNVFCFLLFFSFKFFFDLDFLFC